MELDAAKIWKVDYQTARATIVEYEKVIRELKQQLAKMSAEKDEILQKANEEKEEIEEVLSILLPSFIPYFGPFSMRRSHCIYIYICI